MQIQQRDRTRDAETIFHETMRQLQPAPSALETTRRIVWQAILESFDAGASRAFNSTREGVEVYP